MVIRTKVFRLVVFGLFLIITYSCTEKSVSSTDVEYRRDENGTRILYQIASKHPFGNTVRAYVKDYFENGNIKFKIGFKKGLRDGPFTFYYPDEKVRLEGNFDSGVMEGTFKSYGKIGELLYEKNFKNGQLDGNFSIYYKASSSDVFRYHESIRQDTEFDLVKNHIRLRAKFIDGKPVGKYQCFDHPRGITNLNEADLLNEEGFFDINGLLAEEQIKFYPKTKRLFVLLPGDDRIEFAASENGFSRAIDKARSSILAMPAFRNPNKKPALVYTADDKGNLIAPIWSSYIQTIVLSSSDSINPIEEYAPNLEAFTNFALPKALEMDSNSSGALIEISGLDASGRKVDILWSNRENSKNIPLNARIFAKRTKTRRSWIHGSAVDTDWYLNDGTKILLRGTDDILIDPQVAN